MWSEKKNDEEEISKHNKIITLNREMMCTRTHGKLISNEIFLFARACFKSKVLIDLFNRSRIHQKNIIEI